MKAYKIVQVVDDKLWSYDICTSSIISYIERKRLKKSISKCAVFNDWGNVWRVPVEYKQNKFVRCHRSSPNPWLFVYKHVDHVKNNTRNSRRSDTQIWECEVDQLVPHNKLDCFTSSYVIPVGTYLCTKCKLIRRIL